MQTKNETDQQWDLLVGLAKKIKAKILEKIAARNLFEKRAIAQASAVDLPKTSAEDPWVDKTKAEKIHGLWISQAKKDIQTEYPDDMSLKQAADKIASRYLQMKDALDVYDPPEDDHPPFDQSELNELLKNKPELQSAVKASHEALIEQKRMLLISLDRMIRDYETSPHKHSQSEMQKLRDLYTNISLISAGGEGQLSFEMAAFNELKKAYNQYNNQWKTDTNGFVARINSDTEQNHAPRMVAFALQAFLKLTHLPITQKEREDFEKLKEIELPPKVIKQKEVPKQDKWNQKVFLFSPLKFGRNKSEQTNLRTVEANNEPSPLYVEFRTSINTVTDKLSTYQDNHKKKVEAPLQTNVKNTEQAMQDQNSKSTSMQPDNKPKPEKPLIGTKRMSAGSVPANAAQSALTQQQERKELQARISKHELPPAKNKMKQERNGELRHQENFRISQAPKTSQESQAPQEPKEQKRFSRN